MMTDPYRVAFVRISACISVSFHSFHSSIHANLNVYLLLECPPCNLSPIILPLPILVFHSHRSRFVCFLPSSHQHLAMPTPPLLLPPSLFSLCAAPLSWSSSISTSFSQPPLKKLAIILPHFFASQHAYTHLRSIIYVSITPGGIYLAPKRRILLGKGGIRTPKNAVRSEQILYRSINTRNNYYNQSIKNEFFSGRSHLEL